MIRDRDLQSIQEVRTLLHEAKQAQAEFKKFTQEQVDAVFAAMAEAGYRAAEKLARLAVEETGYGKITDKITKNQFGSRHVYEAYRPMRTVGVIRQDRAKKIIEIAEPVGIVAAIVPTTNPTSTAIFKALIAVKARNAIIVSPHPRAAKCTCEAVRIVTEAAVAAGAPRGLIGCMTVAHLAGTHELMHAREVGVILATGGPSLVRAAYSAGKPAYGVGPGNVPVYIDRSANLPKAIADAVTGKTFDWGTLCSSEQALVVDAPVYEQAKTLLQQNGAHFLCEKEAHSVGTALVGPRGQINPELVGHSPQAIATAAGISVPETAKVLVAELAGVGPDYPLSREKLSPVLAMYRAEGWEAGCDRCIELLNIGGRGHTLAIHAQDENVILQFGLQKPAFRILVNTPASIGAVGYTTSLDPSLTLGCGSLGGNITADNISPVHLMNIKRVAYETKPLGKRRRQGIPEAWKPGARAGQPVQATFPYQKALSSDVSRKGSTPQHAGETAADNGAQRASAEAARQKYGASELSGDEVDRLVAAFLKERGLQ